MTKIKFGTDGWRAIIADTYTNENVARVAAATAAWLHRHHQNPSVCIGHDCRFGGKMFTEVAIKVLCDRGITVHAADKFASTPMVSLGTLRLGANAGVVITASHNPPSYNGYKLKADFGGPANPAAIKEVEELIPEKVTIPSKSLDAYAQEGLLKYVDLEGMYVKHVEDNFDLDAIRNSGIKIGYDAMYGAGQDVMRRLFPDAVFLHCDINPSFRGQAPEPIHKNLKVFSNLIKSSGDIDLGIANDGDADRIGLYDAKGNFVDSHHIILLLVHYLYKYKGMRGKVVNAFSVSGKVKDLCDKYGLEYEVTKIGFKHICEIMVKEDVLLGGEESGGIATKGHIPERDGIWMGLLILEFMAKTGKSLQALIDEVYAEVGAFFYKRDDLHISNEKKHAIMQNCADGKYNQFGDYQIARVETVDGYKFHLANQEWVLIRPSGTEPVLRVYAEAANSTETQLVLNKVHETLQKV